MRNTTFVRLFVFALALLACGTTVSAQVAVKSVSPETWKASEGRRFTITGEPGAFKDPKCSTVTISKVGTNVPKPMLTASNVKANADASKLEFDAGVGGDQNAGEYDGFVCGETVNPSFKINFVSSDNWEYRQLLQTVADMKKQLAALQSQHKNFSDGVRSQLADAEGKLRRVDQLDTRLKVVEDRPAGVTTEQFATETTAIRQEVANVGNRADLAGQAAGRADAKAQAAFDENAKTNGRVAKVASSVCKLKDIQVPRTKVYVVVSRTVYSKPFAAVVQEACEVSPEAQAATVPTPVTK